MLYPYITLPDNTEILHSEILEDGRVKIYIETPDEKDVFHHAVCYLPDIQWEEISGYSESEISYFQIFVQNNADLIIDFSQHGGILNADTE